MNVAARMFLCQEKRVAFVIKSCKGYHFQSLDYRKAEIKISSKVL